MTDRDLATDNPADYARALITQAFAQINQLPHGTEQNAAGLIEAQSHLAQARRALDAWQVAHETPVHTSDRDQRVKLEGLLKRMQESEEHLERTLDAGTVNDR